MQWDAMGCNGMQWDAMGCNGMHGMEEEETLHRGKGRAGYRARTDVHRRGRRGKIIKQQNHCNMAHAIVKSFNTYHVIQKWAPMKLSTTDICRA